MSTNGERAAKYLEQVAKMVLEKGKAYGDSVGNPVRIFSKADQKEGIRVRIDDKLSRIARGNPDTDQEDNIQDLIGYLALFATNDQEQPMDKKLFVGTWPDGPEPEPDRFRPTKGQVCRCNACDQLRYGIGDVWDWEDRDE